MLVRANQSKDLLIDTLPSNIQSTLTGVYSLRLVAQSYLGPVVRIRNGTSGVSQDFYANASGSLGDQLGGVGTSLDSFLAGATGFVTTWYDQSGKGLNATQGTNANQPSITKGDGSYVIRFDTGTQSLQYDGSGASSIWHTSNYTFAVKEQRGSASTANFFLGTSTSSANMGLNLGYRTNTSVTHAQYANDYDATVSGYGIQDMTNTYNPISSRITGSIPLSMSDPFTVPEGSFVFSATAGNYITFTETALTTGFTWWQGGGSTIEFWINCPSFNATRYVIGQYTPTGGSINWGVGTLSTGQIRFYYWNSSVTYNINTTTNLLSVNTWTHVAVTCDGSSTIRIFINGVLSMTPATVQGTPQLSSPFIVGQFNNIAANATVTNVRIVQGAALYTSNFTPLLTSPLTIATAGTTRLLLRVPRTLNRWVFAHHNTDVPGKRMYLNGSLLATNNNNTPLTTPGQAVIGQGSDGTATSYYGDIYEILMFQSSVPVVDPTTISIIDASMATGLKTGSVKITTSVPTTRTIASRADPRGMPGIPPSVLSTCVGAYSARRLLDSCKGPVVRMQRDTDGAQADVWIDMNGTVERVVDLSQDDGATSGGTVTYDGAYRIHTFTSSGNFVVGQARICDVLVVGGGGAGGVRHGGGGGGGGVVYTTNRHITTSQTVVIGGGGSGGNVPSAGQSGNDSLFGTTVAIRGGGGVGSGIANASSGGSGGGAGALTQIAGSGVPSQGNAGGTSPSTGAESSYGGGGGGGASTAGANAVLSGTIIAGNGGSGRLIIIDGTLRYFGGGGGGGCALSGTSAGSGGLGGGGAGGKGAVTSANGTINTGGGGGGGGFEGATNGQSGNGGSGIVIVRTLRHPGIQGSSALQQWLGTSTGTVVRWYDQSGQLNHVTNIRGNPRLSTSPNDAFLWGGSLDGMRFPSSILPSDYTLFSTTQYPPSGSNAAFFTGASNEWFSSFDGGIQKRFGWVTAATANIFSSNVVVTVDQPNYYRANGGVAMTPITSFMRPFPPSDLVDFTTTLTSAAFANGTYTVSSSETENANVSRRSWTLFRNNYNTNNDGYHSTNIFTNYAYTGTGTTNIQGTSITALWIQIQLPQPIVLKGYKFVTRPAYASGKERLPNEYWVVGSNVSSPNWVTLDSNANYTVAMYNTLMTSVENTVEGVFYTPTITQSYNYYRLVVRKITPVSSMTLLNFWNWTLFGEHTSRSGNLSINHGFSTLPSYTSWMVRDVMVFNSTLPLSTVTSIERRLMQGQLGMLDQIAGSGGSGALAAYALRLLTRTYTGPIIQVRNGSTGAIADFYANVEGELGTQYLGGGQNIREWLNGASGFVIRWYDQTGRGFHLLQTTAASQPVIELSTRNGNGIRHQSNKLLATTGNPFGTSTITNMHLLYVSRENVRANNYFVSIGGSSYVHSPWSDGTWYLDMPNANRASGATSVLGRRVVFSGYKSSALTQNGFRINQGTRFTSTGLGTASVDTVQIGRNGVTDHTIYSVIVFGSPLSAATESALESRMSTLCPP